MEELKTACKFCNESIESYSNIDTYKAEDFSKLVHECEIKRIVNEESKSKIVTNDIDLSRKGIIKWLLLNTSKININFWDIDNIILESEDYNTNDQLIRYLKDYGVIIKSKDRYDYESNYHNAILTAATIDCPDLLSWLVDNGSSVECNNDKYEKPLIISAKHGHVRNIIRLLNLAATTEDRDIKYDCELVLEKAIEGNHFHILKWIFNTNLIKNNNISLYTTLKKAIELKHYDIVEWLINIQNVDIKEKDYCGTNFVQIAATTGNIVLIKLLIEKGIPLFHKDQERKTVIHYAAENGHYELLKWLINQGGDIHERKIYGFTPLHLAATSGNIECIKLLVHLGCEVNAKDRNGKTVLHVAAESKKLESVQFLVQHGADINSVDDDRNTVAHFAVCNLEILKWLHENNCDIYKRNMLTKNVLTLACELLEYETVKWLLENEFSAVDAFKGSCNLCYNLNDKWKLFKLCVSHMKDINAEIENCTILHKLAPYKKAVQYLLLEHSNEIDVNNLDKDLNTPLHIALGSSYKSAMLLLEFGANVHVKNITGETPLHYAARHGYLCVIKKLLQLGADVNVKNNELECPLKYALPFGNIIIIKTLIDAGSDVNSKDINNVSVLNAAASSWQWNTVKLLIEYGADINHTTNNRTRNIIHNAISTHDVELITWLLDHGVVGLNDIPEGQNSVLHGVSYINNQNEKYALIKLLIEHGADINGLDYCGNTILHETITNPKIVDYLIANGVNVNIQNEYGLSALHKVTQCYHYANKDVFRHECSAIKKLLDAGANINARDQQGRIPLFEAACETSVNLTRILISYGSDINSKDIDGNTCLYCSSYGEVAHFLCENGADINSKNYTGVSVLQNAIKLVNITCKQKHNIVNIIKNRAINNNNNESYLKDTKKSIRISRNKDYLEYLINNVKDINDVDNEGLTALHVAAQEGGLHVFTKIIERGANVNIRANNGDTVLHTAANHGHANIVKYIMENLDFKTLITPNNENKTPIHLAIIQNSIKIVELLVKYENLNHKTNEMLTALHIAIECKNLELVKLLVTNGANIYETSRNSFTPSHFAAKSCSLEILKYLVDIDTNILHSKTDSGETLLHLAAKFGKFDNVPNKIIKYLLDLNIYSIDCVDIDGNTALHYACGTFMVDIVTMLVEKGAKINLKNIVGNTPFHIAAKTGSIDVINYLLEKNGDMNINNKRGNNSVQISASHSKINPTECLLQRGADLFKKNRKGICLIHQLAISGQTYLLEYLLKHFSSADVNVLNNKKQTPLALAMRYPDKSKNIELLINDINKNAQDIRGNTPMHDACRYVNLKAIDILLLNEVDINIQNNKGDTALHIAVQKLEPNIIKNLLPHFTNYNVKNKLGMNVLHLAVTGNNIEVVEMLINIVDKFSKTNKGETVLHIAAKNTEKEVFFWLIRNHGQELINECNNDNETVLHTCLKLSHHDTNTIELLLGNGAELNSRNSNGDNVLHLSTNYGRVDFVNYFIDKNININESNNLGNCALHIAAENGYLDILKILIGNGSNVNCMNFQGFSPLHYAAKCGQMSVVKYLVQEVKCDVNIRNFDGKLAVELAEELNQNCVVQWLHDFK